MILSFIKINFKKNSFNVDNMPAFPSSWTGFIKSAIFPPDLMLLSRMESPSYAKLSGQHMQKGL